MSAPQRIAPCPWCNQKPVIQRTDCSGFYGVWCAECGGHGPLYALEHGAITAWNRVARDGYLRSVVREAREMLECAEFKDAENAQAALALRERLEHLEVK